MSDWMDELERLGELRDKGLLTNEEFEIEKTTILPSGKEKGLTQAIDKSENLSVNDQRDAELTELEIDEEDTGGTNGHIFVSADGSEVLCPSEISEEELGVALLTGDYIQELIDIPFETGPSDPQKCIPGYGMNEDAEVNQIRRMALKNRDVFDRFPPRLKHLCNFAEWFSTEASTNTKIKMLFADSLGQLGKEVSKSPFLPRVEITQNGIDYIIALGFIEHMWTYQVKYSEELKLNDETHTWLDGASILASTLFPNLGEKKLITEDEVFSYSSRELLQNAYMSIEMKKGDSKRFNDLRLGHQSRLYSTHLIVKDLIAPPQKWNMRMKSDLILLGGKDFHIYGGRAISAVASSFNEQLGPEMTPVSLM